MGLITMNKDALIKEIDCQRDLYNRFWNNIVITATGIITVSFIPNTVYKWVLIAAGVCTIAIFIKGCKNKLNFLRSLIEELKKEK